MAEVTSHMDYVIIGAAALLASLLTFFSGFGLGTILLVALLPFFPEQPLTAVALTAIVHVLNNIFKGALIGKHTDWKLFLKFGLVAAVAALGGAQLLKVLSDLPPIADYSLGGETFIITPVKLTIGILMLFFAVFELLPRFKDIRFKGNALYVGGLLSGFFGGLSGHQGALRTAFLLKTGITKEAFIATGVMIAIVVDAMRIPVYFTHMAELDYAKNIGYLVAAVVPAFVGAYAGRLLLNKVTFTWIQVLASVLIFIMGVLLIAGLV